MQNTRLKKSKSGQISLKDKFVLSPVEKYIYYDKFPVKLLIHLFLIVFTTIQVLDLVDSSGAAHAREQKRMFKYLLLDSTDEEDNIQLLTPLDFQSHLQGVVSAFQNLNMYVFQEANTNPTEYNLNCYYQASLINENNDTEVNSVYPVDILNGVFEPFDINNIFSVKAFINTVVQASFTATNVITTINQNGGASVCAVWNISLLYNFQSLSAINVQISSNEMPCGSPDAAGSFSLYTFSYTNKLIHLIVLILAITSIILAIKHIYSVGTLFMKAKHAYKKMFKMQKLKRKNYKMKFEGHKEELMVDAGGTSNNLNINELFEKNLSWEELSMMEKIKFFNFWFITSIIGNCFQIIGSFSILLSSASTSTFTDKTLTIDNIFIGFGCFFAWFQTFCYLEFSRDVVLLTSIFKKSFMLNVVFFGMIIPIFMAFVCLGQAFFWDYSKFQSTGSSSNSLFDLSCGYNVYESFTDTMNEPYFKQLYLFAYLVTFYTSIQNIFVAIVMEGYEKTLTRKALDNDDPFPDISSQSEAELSDAGIKSDIGRIKKKEDSESDDASFVKLKFMKGETDKDKGKSTAIDKEPDKSIQSGPKLTLKKSSSLEKLNEEKTPKVECVNKLRALSKRIKEKLIEMNKLVELTSISGWNQHNKDFIEGLYDQLLEDLCNKINFLSKGAL